MIVGKFAPAPGSRQSGTCNPTTTVPDVNTGGLSCSWIASHVTPRPRGRGTYEIAGCACLTGPDKFEQVAEHLRERVGDMPGIRRIGVFNDVWKSDDPPHTPPFVMLELIGDGAKWRVEQIVARAGLTRGLNHWFCDNVAVYIVRIKPRVDPPNAWRAVLNPQSKNWSKWETLAKADRRYDIAARTRSKAEKLTAKVALSASILDDDDFLRMVYEADPRYKKEPAADPQLSPIADLFTRVQKLG